MTDTVALRTEQTIVTSALEKPRIITSHETSVEFADSSAAAVTLINRQAPGDTVVYDVRSAPTGSGSASAQTYFQPFPARVWVIPHTFPRPPMVAIFDTSGAMIYSDIEIVDASTISIHFANPATGEAVLT